jgi:hypothetical protein
MDPIRFDTLARTLVARLPRRGLGPLAAAVLALGLNEAGARGRKGDTKNRQPCAPCKKRKKGRCKRNKSDGTACPGGVCQGGACGCPSGTRDCGSGVCRQCCADSDCAKFCVDSACAPCPRCYFLNADGACERTQEPMNGRCPCGFEYEASTGQCMRNNCRDCFENVGGICVPEPDGTAPNRLCECGFQNVGGICVPRYPM